MTWNVCRLASYEEINTLFRTFQVEFPALCMTKEQFVKKIEEDVLPVGECKRFATYLFQIFDENHDGSIDFPEFIYGLYRIKRIWLIQGLN